jgi:3'(2'), 5'-bisphosphate nucleotidase
VILEEAGGKLTDLAGKPLDYRATDPQVTSGIIASNGVVHAHILGKLA